VALSKMAHIKNASPQSVFPTYLLPPIPFRRHHSATEPEQRGNWVNPADSVNGNKFLGGHLSYLRCGRCATGLCMTSQIISKGFTGRHGRAYLVSATRTADAISMTSTSSSSISLPNTVTQKAVPRQLVTGAHTVSDISCVFCGSVLGWKYVAAEDESQRYKVGKFILETKRISTSSCWEYHPGLVPLDIETGVAAAPNDVEFDSQDEDECEDLFSGMWSPGLAARRRCRRFEKSSSVSSTIG